MNSFTIEAFVLLGAGLSIIGFRMISRILQVGFKGLQADDYVMLLAAVVYGLETAAAYSVGAKFKGLANNAMTVEERASLSPYSHEHRLRVGGSKLQLIGWSLYTSLLWLLKLCLVILYARLTEGINYMKARVWTGFGLIFSTYVVTTMSIHLACGLPYKKNWQIHPDPGNSCQPAISRIDILVTVVMNIVTDMYLMSIPLPMLWKTSLPKRKKYLLCIVFSGAVFVMAAGILRSVVILEEKDPIHGAQQAGSWAVRETFVAVVTSNLPLIYPTLRQWTASFVRFSMSSHSISSKWSKITPKSRVFGGFISLHRIPGYMNNTQENNQGVSSESREFILHDLKGDGAARQSSLQSFSVTPETAFTKEAMERGRILDDVRRDEAPSIQHYLT